MPKESRTPVRTGEAGALWFDLTDRGLLDMRFEGGSQAASTSWRQFPGQAK